MTPEERRAAELSLDALTARPLPEDILLFALPVCAPYRMLTSYKFKVRTVPCPGAATPGRRGGGGHLTALARRR